MSKRLVDSASSSVLEMGRAEREMIFFRMVNSRERSNVVDGDGMEGSYCNVLINEAAEFIQWQVLAWV